MSVKLRLQRVGTKKKPFYRVVAVDSRKKRGGDVLDNIGRYQPTLSKDQFIVDKEKVLNWLSKGAQPTLTIERFLKKAGMYKNIKNAE